MNHVLNFNKWAKLNEEEAMDATMSMDSATAGNYDGYAQKIVGMLMTALGGFNSDEQGVLDALKLIAKYGGQPVYDSMIKIVNTSPNVKKQFGYNFNTIAGMIKTKISKPSSISAGMDYTPGTSNPASKLGLGLTDEEWTRQYDAILSRYNENEEF